mmetsp:Transcript_13403/g.20911  ORF Transcript_13403/g.20911 Transcript_13403/m.20911 type:complete len:310 (-) Transcript_13403:117-1046(-)
MSTGGDSTSPPSSTSRMTSPPENGSPQQEDVARPLMRVVEQQKKKMTIQRTKPNREHILDADPGNRSLRAPPIRQSWPATQAETVAATTLGTHLTSIVSTESVQSDPGGNRHPASTYNRTNPPPTKKKNMEDDNMAPDHIPPIPVGRKRNSVVSLGNDSLGDPPSRESRTTASNHVTGKLPVPQQQPQQQSSSSSSVPIYHLEGGILAYLDTVPPSQSKFKGECYVFDQRVAVTHGLHPTRQYDMCFGCRKPLSMEHDMTSHPDFIEGICCKHCKHDMTDKQKQRFQERQKQIMQHQPKHLYDPKEIDR